MKDNARIVRDASDLYGQGEKMDAITKKNAPSLTVLSPEKQALFVSKYGDKLKNDPGAQDRASKALMAEGIDPSFLSGATAQRQPDLSLPTGADSQVDATNERKRMRSAPPSTSGGLVTVPAPSASEQQAMASALPPTTFESASPEAEHHDARRMYQLQLCCWCQRR